MKKSFNLLFCIFSFAAYAQVGPYSWQDHLSLNTCNTLCRFNGKIYASNYNGIVMVDEEEGSTTRLNKTNGLNDMGIRLIRVNPNNNKLLVIYDDANIDVIDANEKIQNYPDIKLKTINGKKSVNEICFKDKFAYLATGLGIILFDTDKLEIKDTYVIGPNGTNLEIYQVALDDSLIFAATANGLYKSNYKLKILNDYNNWQLVGALPSGVYSGVIRVSNKMLAAYAPSKTNPNLTSGDSLYEMVNGVWSKFYPNTLLIRKLSYVNGNKFALFDQFGPSVTDVYSKVLVNYITTFNGAGVKPEDIIFFTDKSGLLSYWVADLANGLFQTYGAFPFGEQHLRSINGTDKNFISNIDVSDGQVAISPIYPNNGGGTNYDPAGINIYRDKNWSYIKSDDPNHINPFFPQPIWDINSVLFDRKDKTHMWAGSWSSGLLEYKNDILVGVYNKGNVPSFMNIANGNANTRVSGMSMDKDGNLWMATSDVSNYLTVRKKDGTFIHFNFGVGHFVRRILVDRNNYVWMLHERDEGLTVFKNENFAQPQLNVNFRALTKDVNSGNLESNSTYAIAEDKDGKIWVGTGAGIRVFYNPTNMFTATNYDAQPIKIVQDGNVELLLEKEIVTSIAVDGANNKWVGTQTGGLYCFNSDGLTQIYHFTKDNSPLYSNNVVDLNYDKITGDIYIGTDVGLQSFRSAIIEGDENYNNIYAYPNPVKPNYTGNVFVRGLIDNSVVKITDESGNLVWETKSQGGQIEWPVKNLAGTRAATGVYVVYAHTTTGEFKALTKLLVVN